MREGVSGCDNRGLAVLGNNLLRRVRVKAGSESLDPILSRERREIPPDPIGLRARIAPRPEWLRPSLEWLLDLDEERWRQATRKTALRRTRYRGLMRNALVAAGNSKDPTLRDRIQRLVDSPDELIAEHARWAIAQLDA